MRALLCVLLLSAWGSHAAEASPAGVASALLVPPAEADLGQIVARAPAAAGAGAEVYRWDRFPDVLIVDSDEYRTGDLHTGFLDRLYAKTASEDGSIKPLWPNM